MSSHSFLLFDAPWGGNWKTFHYKQSLYDIEISSNQRQSFEEKGNFRSLNTLFSGFLENFHWKLTSTSWISYAWVTWSITHKEKERETSCSYIKFDSLVSQPENLPVNISKLHSFCQVNPEHECNIKSVAFMFILFNIQENIWKVLDRDKTETWQAEPRRSNETNDVWIKSTSRIHLETIRTCVKLNTCVSGSL